MGQVKIGRPWIKMESISYMVYEGITGWSKRLKMDNQNERGFLQNDYWLDSNLIPR